MQTLHSELENLVTQPPNLAHAAEQAIGVLDLANPYEFVLLASAIITGLLIARLLSSRSGRHSRESVAGRVLHFVAPLTASLVACAITAIGLSLLRAEEAEPSLLPFALKLMVAWFAIQLVNLMSSRQSAGWLIVCVVAPITLLHLFGLWEFTVATLTSASFTLGKTEINLYMILKAVTVIFVLWWLASFLVRVTDHRLRRIKDMRASSRTLILKIFQIFLYCFVFIMALQAVGIDLTALSVFGGALGVGLGFGLQKIASNFISGIILLFEKSVEVGSMIELADGTVGFIRQTHARYTLLETQDGKEILIPNEEFISQRVISWTHSDKYARADIHVTISYDSDVELARRIMLEAAEKHPKRTRKRPSMCVLHAFRDSGMELHLHFWVSDVTDGRMEPKSEVMLTILKAFREQGITIPYPQRELRVMNVTPGNVAVAAGGA
jgi:small-conductance mechanosensitive channel